MTSSAATLPLRTRRTWRVGAEIAAEGEQAVRARSPLLAMLAFAVLATYCGTRWAGLVTSPPMGRTALALLATLAGGAVLALLSHARIPRPLAWALGAVASVAATLLGLLAMGLPAHLLAPAHWDTLAHNVRRGVGGLGDATYPYDGRDWSRLAILLALPLLLGVAAALAFWPGRDRAGRRLAVLVVLLGMYATAVTVAGSGGSLSQGFVLLIAVAGWLWLPSLDRGDMPAAAGMVALAGLVALPLAGRLDAAQPWLDYQDWNWSWSNATTEESFSWDHTYGPLDWPRTGRTLMEVGSAQPHYWRATTLDRFDGFRWLSSGESGASLELPQPIRTGPHAPPPSRQLNPHWVHRIGFSIRSFDSPLVVGAGAVLSVQGLSGALPTVNGLSLTQPLSDGASYSILSYDPEPSAKRMRDAPATAGPALARALEPYTTLSLPHSQFVPAPPDGPDLPPIPAHAYAKVTLHTLTVPLWSGGASSPAAARALLESPYAGAYRLARQITAGASTEYDAVTAIESYLRTGYSYSESPPDFKYPLRAFLLNHRIGYCQQFSGGMALMLRMLGIPARVASGFSPGKPTAGGYVVQDFDAHSWVEVYFNGIGWVTFDPTSGASPARSRSAGPRAGNAPSTGLLHLGQRGPAHGGSSSAPLPGADASTIAWGVLAGAALAVVLAACALLAARVWRYRRLDPAAVAEAQLRELESAFGRLRGGLPGGTTLLELERRLADVAGAQAAGYAAKLRAARYGRDPARPPTPSERRALRRELVWIGSRLRRWRGFVAIPPGAPRMPAVRGR